MEELNKLGYCDNEFVNNLDINSNIQIIGRVQSGKTKMSTDLALRILFEKGSNVAYVLNNFKMDKLSWEDRFMRLVGNYNRHSKNLEELKSKMAKYVVFFDCTCNIGILGNLINESSYPKIFVFLGNSKTVKKFNQMYKKINRNLYTIIDESDALCVSNGSKIVARELHKLMELSQGSSRITATPNAHIILKEKNFLYCRNVYITQTTFDHVSYGHPKFEIIQTKNNLFLSGGKRDELPVYEDDQIDEITDIIYDEMCISETIGRVPIGFINVTYLTDQHNYIVELVQEYFPDTTFVCIYKSEITIKYSRETNLTEEEITERKTQSLQQNMSYLQEEIETGLYDHSLILLVGSNQITRGQSPRSEVSNYRSYRDIIYAQFMICASSGNKANDSLVQTMLRVGGVFKGQDEHFDGVRLYTTKDMKDNLDITMDWIERSILEFSKEENKDLKTLEVVPKVSKKPSRKPFPLSKGKFSWIKSNRLDGYYHTEESMERNLQFVPETGTINTNGDTIASKIYRILKDTNEWMTAKEVMNSQEDWNMTTKTPLFTITTTMIRLFNKTIIKRKKNGDGIYVYKVT